MACRPTQFDHPSTGSCSECWWMAMVSYCCGRRYITVGCDTRSADMLVRESKMLVSLDWAAWLTMLFIYASSVCLIFHLIWMDVAVYAASSFQAPKWFSICTDILVWKLMGTKNSQSIIIRWGLFFIVSYWWFSWSLCTGEQFHRECCAEVGN